MKRHPFFEVFSIPAVWVGALGYFVDMYDLVIFGVLRVASLHSLGVPEAELMRVGSWLLNSQMAGLLIGGVLWGTLGDLRGRKSVLFGSILLYSAANIANSFVTSIPTYAVLRFLAGLGLAGELGSAITLVGEVLPRETRGYGTTAVATFGLAGAIAAAITGSQVSWRTAFFLGGAFGMGLLVARSKLGESGLFRGRGDLGLLLRSPRLVARYIRCILLGVPIWFATGVIVTFAPEVSHQLGVTGPVTAGTAILLNYVGGVLGDLGSGLLSQRLRSRKRVVWLFVGAIGTFVAALLCLRDFSPWLFYFFSFLFGLGSGYWVIFVTFASEQFGTNLRATVTTSAPNFVRGAVIPLIIVYQWLAREAGLGTRASLAVLSFVTVSLSLLALSGLRETFARDLDFNDSAEPA